MDQQHPRLVKAQIDPELGRQLERLARENDRPLAGELRRALRAYIAQESGDPSKNSNRNEGTRSLTTNDVGICRQLGGVPVAAKPWVVSEELWERIEPLLPRVERRFRYPGRKRLPDREALQGILFVLHMMAALRQCVVGDLESEAAKRGVLLGDRARAVALAEGIYARTLTNALTDGAPQLEASREAARFATSQATEIASGRDSYNDSAERYIRMSGSQPVEVPRKKDLQFACGPFRASGGRATCLARAKRKPRRGEARRGFRPDLAAHRLDPLKEDRPADSDWSLEGEGEAGHA
jgi:hypothetical protein